MLGYNHNLVEQETNDAREIGYVQRLLQPAGLSCLLELKWREIWEFQPMEFANRLDWSTENVEKRRNQG